MGEGKERIHLLVIESNDDRCGSLCGCLDPLGYEVVIARSASQALEMLALCETERSQARSFDLVLLAVEMQDVEGCYLIEKLKADPNRSQIPVIMLSGGNDDAMVARCLELGAEEYLCAPFHPALLKTRIDFCLEAKRLRAQRRHQAELLQYERDMQIARQIQLNFLPGKLPQPSGWEIGARFKPARQVAGDFFDGFSLPGDRVGLVIADVCDKGVGPALFMALCRSLIRAFAEQHRPLGWLGDSTGEDAFAGLKRGDAKKRRMMLSAGSGALLAVELTNNYIANNHRDMYMFATLFFGVLDPCSGALTYVNGGHDAPIVVGCDGALKAKLTRTGPAVGMRPNMHFDIQQVRIEPGETLIAFTDGVTDALNASGEKFSRERFFSLLAQPAPSADGLLDRVESALYSHIGDAEQFDDITMLVARRAPASIR